MFFVYRVVADFPKYNGRIVPEIDDHIPHQFHTLIPLAPEVFALFISSGLCADDAPAVTGADIRRTGGHMHPAYMVCVALADQFRIIILQPVHGRAHSGPFVGGTLGIAGKPYRHIMIISPLLQS